MLLLCTMYEKSISLRMFLPVRMDCYKTEVASGVGTDSSDCGLFFVLIFSF